MIKIKDNYVRKALLSCKLALTLLLLFMLGRMFLVLGGDRLIFTPASVAASEDVSDTVRPRPLHDLQDYSTIISRNIFGFSGNVQNDRPDGSANPLDEQLGITLIGTLAGSPAVSRAVIKDLKTGSVGLYKIGDTVANATIESIERECVVLSDHGSRKTLCLGTETSPTGLQAGKIIKRWSANPDSEENQPDTAASPPVSQQSSNSSLESILANIVIEPHKINDRVDGLKISGIENAPVLKALGLRDGDVIQVVNGQNVSTKQQAFQILQKARSQDSVNVELLRNNKVKTLFFPLAGGL